MNYILKKRKKRAPSVEAPGGKVLGLGALAVSWRTLRYEGRIVITGFNGIWYRLDYGRANI